MQIQVHTITGAITLESFSMPISFVKTPIDKRNIIDVNWDGLRKTLADVKAEIWEKEGIPLQRLFFAGRQLKNETTLGGFTLLVVAEAQEEAAEAEAAEAAARRARRMRAEAEAAARRTRRVRARRN